MFIGREVRELAQLLKENSIVPMSDEEAIREAVQTIQSVEAERRKFPELYGGRASTVGSGFEWFLAVVVFVVMMVVFALGGKLFGAW